MADSLTPVRLPDSQSPIKNDINLVTCKTRLDAAVQELQSGYAKWQLAQQRGTALCYAIEAKKTRCFEKSNGESDSYPDDLQLPCNKLAIIASIFTDITRNTRETLRQLRGITRLAGEATDIIYYRSWQLRQFVAFAEELIERYEKESSIKQRVMQNIAHCKQRSELIAYTTAWE
ncbi:CG34174 [Drosophila busckii]|uniref:CG34174 n=1 Tax=Drosophila busckii TaxID=30019 RepID=A0A0M4ECK0_DROBS|nr:CG34174 [Drosophila busckii]